MREETVKAYASWLENYKKRQDSHGKKQKVNYDTMSDANNDRIKEAVLASMGIQTNPDDTKSSGTSPKKPTIYIVDISVLSSSSPTRAIMPTPIMFNFPHICLQLGSTIDCADCPVVHCVVDTAATLTTGNFHFVAALAKKHPHCVTKIYVPDNYIPIVLSGIIQHGGESVTTELTVGFQFHLPYKTRDGQDTSILIVTGPHVTVNTIARLPSIQATRMIINLSDNVADMRALLTSPFLFEYCHAMVHVPIVDEYNAACIHLRTTHQDIIKQIKALQWHFAAVSHLADVNDNNSHKGVSFRSRAVGEPMSKTGTLNPALRQDLVLGKHGLIRTPMDNYSDPESLRGPNMYDNQ